MVAQINQYLGVVHFVFLEEFVVVVVLVVAAADAAVVSVGTAVVVAE